MNESYHIVFPAQKEVRLEPYGLPAMDETAVRVRSICSLVSTGTEMTVFNGTFDPGTHWHNWAKYPFKPGYATIGQVEAVGAKVARHKVGDIVGLRRNHASVHVAHEKEAFPVPAGVSPDQAAWFAFFKITYICAVAADYKLGDSAVIVGAGPIGQASIRWAATMGLRHVVAVDLTERRLPLARAGGATVTIAASLPDAKAAIIEQCGEIPRIILDTTGNAHVFSDCLRLARQFGRIVLVGDTGSPDSQHLTPDVMIKGLTITAGHDTHILNPEATAVFDLFFEKVSAGRINLDGMTTHRFRPDECADAYNTLATQRADTMGVLFDWE
jgi:2-desacetyl-2-hydroxyethyl bacteriochlorophyllide A dehydrogenase